jgi:hypothetical protein
MPSRLQPMPDTLDVPPAPPIFGTEMRTRLLLLIAVLDETYPAQLSTTPALAFRPSSGPWTCWSGRV